MGRVNPMVFYFTKEIISGALKVYNVQGDGKGMTNRPVIIVTGASGGIGEAAAILFSQRGYDVVLAARREDKLVMLSEGIKRNGGDALPVTVDVTDPNDIERLVQKTMERFGRVDVLFNNAGLGELNWLEELNPLTDIKKVIDTNLSGVIWMARAVLPVMIQQRRGHIINMSSAAGLIAPPTYSVYSASKFGVKGFTEALRREVGIYGIRVSAIYPGAVKTDFVSDSVNQRKTGIRTPDWLVLSVDDVARSVYGLVKKPRRALVIPWYLGIASFFNQILPGLIDWGIEIFFVRRERNWRG